MDSEISKSLNFGPEDGIQQVDIGFKRSEDSIVEESFLADCSLSAEQIAAPCQVGLGSRHYPGQSFCSDSYEKSIYC